MRRLDAFADAIGIELGDWMESFTARVRADLALDRLRVRRDDAVGREPGAAIA